MNVDRRNGALFIDAQRWQIALWRGHYTPLCRVPRSLRLPLGVLTVTARIRGGAPCP